MATVLLLLASNVFMTMAWYGHLRWRDPQAPLAGMWKIVLISWGIAFFEYCLQVPANRLGYGRFSAMQLKIMQEVLSILVFIGFSALWLRETPQWNHVVAFGLLLAAVAFAFLPTRS
jgi:hypothetical protein